MKGLWAKKYAKKKQQADSGDKLERLTAHEIADLEAAVKKYQMEKTNQIEKNNQVNIHIHIYIILYFLPFRIICKIWFC